MDRLRVFGKVFFACIGVIIVVGGSVAITLWVAAIASGVFGIVGALAAFLIMVSLIIALIVAFAP